MNHLDLSNLTNNSIRSDGQKSPKITDMNSLSDTKVMKLEL